MRLSLTIHAALLIALISTAARAASPEFRGLWVHNWRPGLLSPAEIDETVRWAKDCNMNALIVQVRRLGDAYYDSTSEPRATNIQGDKGFDPLAHAIKRARENNMEIHAWFNVYRVWNLDPKAVPPPTHVIKLHPEWLTKDDKGNTTASDGRFLDPGVPEVRKYLVEIIAELVTKYDLDGVMLDYIRYPGKKWGYNDTAVGKFNRRYGRSGKPSPSDPLWCAWRRDQVTETVRAIYNEVHRLKPHMKVSAATIAWGNCPSDFKETTAYTVVFQDWRLWMRSGILDANMPMNYKDDSDPKQRKWFADWLDGALRWSYGRHVYCGQMVMGDNICGAVGQVKTARRKGMHGIIGFAFSQLDCKEALLHGLRSEVFDEPAPVPEMPWKKRVARKA